MLPPKKALTIYFLLSLAVKINQKSPFKSIYFLLLLENRKIKCSYQGKKATKTKLEEGREFG